METQSGTPGPAVGAELRRLSGHPDGRGRLDAADLDEALGAPAARFFVVTGVPPGITRGGHALRRGRELLVCPAGSCTVECETGTGRATFVLDDPGLALHLPPKVWVTYRHATATTALVVLCTEPFDPADMVRDHAEFLALAGTGP